MTYITDTKFLLEVSKGEIPGYSVIHKFGRNEALGTSLTPICNGGFYQTPTSTVTLEAVSTSTNDTSAGSGARELTVEYLDSSFNPQTGTMTMAGTSASTTIAGVLRVTRVYVSSSGTYATQSASSQAGTITVRVSGGGATWVTLPLIGGSFGVGQSLIGAYTVPAGKTAYILSQTMTVNATKTATMVFFKRENADDVTSPYDAMRAQNIYTGVQGVNFLEHLTNESYPEKTDIGFLGFMSTGTGEVSVEFELLLVDN